MEWWRAFGVSLAVGGVTQLCWWAFYPRSAPNELPGMSPVVAVIFYLLQAILMATFITRVLGWRP